MRRADYEFIRAHRAEMSERQLAEELKVSKTTVHRAVKRLGLMPCGERPQPQARAVETPAENGGDRLVLLRAQAAHLRAAMPEASGASLAALSKEYRATLEEIAVLEGAPADAERQDKGAEVTSFDAILERRALRAKAAQA